MGNAPGAENLTAGSAYAITLTMSNLASTGVVAVSVTDVTTDILTICTGELFQRAEVSPLPTSHRNAGKVAAGQVGS